MTRRRRQVATVITRLEGGAGVLALRGARALDAASHRVTIIAGSGGRLLREAASCGLETVVEPALCAPIAPWHDLKALRNLSTLFARRGFDVVHTHCAKAGAVGRLAAHRTGVPRIVHTFHGFPFHPFQSVVRHRGYVAVERGLGSITDVALGVGTGVTVEAVRRALVSPERIRTIGVAVDPEAPEATDSARRRARRALDVPEGATVVGAVGRVTYQKAPEDFVRALRALARPNVVGVWVGGGELAGEVRRLAARVLPRGSLLITGDRADVTELLPAFDVFALPSRYEGLPLAVVEAMVSGVPVVATAVNAVSDAVLPGETGLLVPPGRPELLAGAVAHLLDHPHEAARMAAAARARVRPHHTAATLAEALTAAYQPIPPPQINAA